MKLRFKRYSKIYSSSGASTPDNTAFEVDGMVWFMKTWKSQEQSTAMTWKKKVFT